MNKGGRPLNSVWMHFDKVENNSKTIARCKYCNHQMANRAGRMKKHYEKCSNDAERIAVQRSHDPASMSIPSVIQQRKRAHSPSPSPNPAKRAVLQVSLLSIFIRSLHIKQWKFFL